MLGLSFTYLQKSLLVVYILLAVMVMPLGGVNAGLNTREPAANGAEVMHENGGVVHAPSDLSHPFRRPPPPIGHTASSRAPPNQNYFTGNWQQQNGVHFDPATGSSTAATDFFQDLSRDFLELSRNDSPRLPKILRQALAFESAILLTHSLYTTFILMGGCIFGFGSLLLAWKVFHSVRSAATLEPVTVPFLFSIPGLRYLNNHLRFHLFNEALQPRRRFASFVGASGGSLDLSDFDMGVGRPSSAPPRLRRESILRHEIFPSAPPVKSRKSVSKPSTTTQVKKTASMVSNIEKDRRTSLSLPPSSFSIDEEVELSLPQRKASFDHSSTNLGEFKVLETIPNYREDTIPIAAPQPIPPIHQIMSFDDSIHRTSVAMEAISKLMICGENFQSVSEEEEVSKTVAVPRVSLTEKENSDLVTDSAWEEGDTLNSFSEQEVTVSEDIQVSFDLPEHITNCVKIQEKKEFAESIPIPATSTKYESPKIVESKLFKRFSTSFISQNRSIPSPIPVEVQQEHHSKLSRHISRPTPLIPSEVFGSGVVSDPVDERLVDSDLTPPPGFTRRHSSAVNQPRPILKGSRLLHNETLSEEDSILGLNEEEEILTVPTAKIPELSQFSSRRSFAWDPTEQKSTEPRRLHRMASAVERTVSDSNIDGESKKVYCGKREEMSWRWFIQDDFSAMAPVSEPGESPSLPSWEIPLRSQSTDLFSGDLSGRSSVVGSGHRSVDMTPSSPVRRLPGLDNTSQISLGIFDDVFSKGPLRRHNPSD